MSPTHIDGPTCPGCDLKLAQADQRLQDWFNNNVKPKYPSAHISWSYRGMTDQEQAFSEGKTQLHFPNSAHNKQPAMALDLFSLVAGKALWPPKFFIQINADIIPSDQIHWGGVWKTLGDGDHFELLP